MEEEQLTGCELGEELDVCKSGFSIAWEPAASKKHAFCSLLHHDTTQGRPPGGGPELTQCV